MAALQHTPISLQSQTPSSPPQLSSTLTPRTSTLSFSFSSTFTPIPLKLSSSATAVVTLRRNGGGALGARMNASAAASYATALADVAKSNNTLETTAGDVEKIEKFFGEPSVFDFFINPTIDLDKKRQVLDEIAKSSTLQPHTVNFLNILVDAKRIDLIKDIVKEYEVVYNKITDTELAIVTSVVKLESQHLAQIAKQVQKLTGAKNVRIKTEIDPSLVAGFTVRYGNSGSKLIDLSVKKQLEEIAAELDLGDIKLNL
ncbi:ATP synthase delta chain chloroplastic [Prunus yedoensis var. nudiflora]|uniref:ATP synthase delta chain chloroplastic n=1 Tax=Prunus yedoensis var. nudiflora TaxID=2094558 RepID=A0A314U8X5_PRUYE|nr:ATP synthase delta chain chloroplastic [Prunus yedoensis var. nudiflora]PQQ06206.1 ATP synthase delta chain chloroplastic [Prunus yedoensis var. nudiflora]